MAKPENERAELEDAFDERFHAEWQAQYKSSMARFGKVAMASGPFFEIARDLFSSAILARQTAQEEGSSGGLGQPGSGSRDDLTVDATAALAGDRVLNEAIAVFQAWDGPEVMGFPLAMREAVRVAYKHGWNDREGDLMVAVDRIYPDKAEVVDILPREQSLLDALTTLRDDYRVNHTSKFAHGIAAGALERHGVWFAGADFGAAISTSKGRNK